ncbi:MOSC domain-containing protein [Modestobacter sp. DSM 44400]|uniref:MOSC domain-containing protein n=1 Tax=Modestobacter sp. DSM 44400 TaxID=1550230 RepID=UPI00158785AB|nr:MOSC domain-containing protein [Modestobacter sp. DSM 44400]
MSRVLGRPVQLRRETDVPHHDESPVHLITTSSVAEPIGRPIDARRFRANVVLDTGATTGRSRWRTAGTGATSPSGTSWSSPLGPGMPRCRMADLSVPGQVEELPILKTIARHHDVLFGLQAHVARGGHVRCGDTARLI